MFVGGGVVRRDARGQGLRGGDDAPGAAARGARGSRTVLEGLHPRHRAGVPQADDRAARDVPAADVAGADRRLDVRERPPAPRSSTSWRPDAIIEDNVVAFAAIPASGRPWARIVSCNPCEVKDRAGPAGVLRLPDRRPRRVGRRSGPSTTACSVRRSPGSTRGCREHGGPPLPSARDYMYESPFLNMYLFPEATDYRRATPLPPTWHRLDSSVRTDEPFDVDAALPGDAPLVYLSLGSLGSADVELMQRLIDVLGTTDYRVIVSKGPQHELLDARRQHVRRGVPAAALDPAAGRRGHHARRQQHRDGVLPLRQADDRAAAVLGSVRQRAARGRAAGTACGWTRTASRTNS